LGIFRVDLGVGDFDGSNFEPIDALVDTGASYTSIPEDILIRLGVQPEEERNFVLANGQTVSRSLAWIRVRLEGKEQPTLVIFGDRESQALLGAFTLEGFGLSVDSLGRRLVRSPGYLVGLRDP